MTYTDRLETLDGTRTDADALADAILNGNSPEFILDQEGTPRAMRFADSTLIDLDELEPHPHRHRGTTRLDNVPSFLGWITDNIVAGSRCAVYADQERGAVTAILNDHEPARAGWRDYKARYPIALTSEWLHWSQSISESWFDGPTFAEIIEDYAHLIASPPTADLAELVTNFKATRRSEFQDEIRDDNGDRALVWRTETSTGELWIPDAITLLIRVYEGAEEVPVECRFRYRISDEGKATFGVRIAGVEQIERAAFEQLTSQIGVNLPEGVEIYVGAAES